jgi:hypothetical protein
LKKTIDFFSVRVYNIIRKKESGTPKNREREKKMKVVVNKCYGGFGLSEKARKMLNADIEKVWELEDAKNRNNPELINAVETLGDEANTRSSELKVVEIPETATDWDIKEYDGFETLLYVLNGKIFYA